MCWASKRLHDLNISRFFFRETLGIHVLGPGKRSPLTRGVAISLDQWWVAETFLAQTQGREGAEEDGVRRPCKVPWIPMCKKMLCCLILGPISNLFQGWKATQFWDWKSGHGLHKVRRSMGQGRRFGWISVPTWPDLGRSGWLSFVRRFHHSTTWWT